MEDEPGESSHWPPNLEFKMPASHIEVSWVELPSLVRDSSFLPMQTLGGVDNGSSNWPPVNYMEEIVCVPLSLAHLRSEPEVGTYSWLSSSQVNIVHISVDVT